MAFNLFRYVKNGDIVAKEGTDELFEVGGKVGKNKIILVPAGANRTKVTDKQLYVGKEEFNNNFYYHRDNLTDWAVFSTKEITARLNKLCS